ncbi:MAG: TraR/DksA C4-type zinc finger protein [Rubrobacteraceae bacterium]
MANNGLDKDFIAQQKERLQDLKEELVQMRRGMEEDERDRSQDEQDGELDSGDMSQQIFSREMDASIGEQLEHRSGYMDRALKKIEEGSYGICDDTGEEIAKGRLEAVPEAIRTVEAQQSFERERRPAGGGGV